MERNNFKSFSETKNMIIQTQNLSKIYRTEEVETTALDGVNFQVEEGEFVSIMGPSGCGKSTLLNVVGLIDTIDDGGYFFMDKDVSSFNERQRANIRKGNIGFIFQSFNLIDELTVFENVELPLLYLKVAASERKKRVHAVLERMEIMHRRNHFPQQLSGGQQQRVAVGRAVITNPKVILADEPTGNLDSKNGDEVMNILTQLNESGTTIIMVTHSPTYAEYGNRTVHLFDGKIITENLNGEFHV
jgi:putative ABC transport system ATP-binding protein